MKNTWFTADTHFSHTNIIKYCNRPFVDAREQDEILVVNWNKYVSKGDDVFFLGDFAFSTKEYAEAILGKLHGNIYFIRGNHDKAASSIRNNFQWFREISEIEIDDIPITLSHFAFRVWNKSHYGAYHLFGHSHNTLPEDVKLCSMDVGVDAVAAMTNNVPSGVTPPIGSTKPQDYRPLSWTEVKAFMAKKKFVPVTRN